MPYFRMCHNADKKRQPETWMIFNDFFSCSFFRAAEEHAQKKKLKMNKFVFVGNKIEPQNRDRINERTFFAVILFDTLLKFM